jgi:mycothiol system anti-sigma-R factor
MGERQMGSEESDVDCNETIGRLYHYLDGELTDERRTEIRRHLDECSPCLGAYDFESDLRNVISNRCKDHVPDSLRQRVHDAILEEERREASGRSS